MCTVPVSLARLAGRSIRGTGPGMGGGPMGTVGGSGKARRRRGQGERSGKRPLGGTWGKWFGGNGKVPLKVPLRAGPNLRLISSTPLEPPFVLHLSDILKIRTLVQGANNYFIFFDIY
jgi:hypothetical protein